MLTSMSVGRRTTDIAVVRPKSHRARRASRNARDRGQLFTYRHRDAAAHSRASRRPRSPSADSSAGGLRARRPGVEALEDLRGGAGRIEPPRAHLVEERGEALVLADRALELGAQAGGRERE